MHRNGLSGSFDFEVVQLYDSDTQWNEQENGHVPIFVKPIPCTYSCDLECDFVTPKLQGFSRFVREQCLDQLNYDYYRGMPIIPQWSKDEENLMALLWKAGGKPEESWTAILQYALVLRNADAVAQRWQKMLRENSRRHARLAQGKTSDELIMEAKCLCSKMLWHYQTDGIPGIPGSCLWPCEYDGSDEVHEEALKIAKVNVNGAEDVSVLSPMALSVNAKKKRKTTTRALNEQLGESKKKTPLEAKIEKLAKRKTFLKALKDDSLEDLVNYKKAKYMYREALNNAKRRRPLEALEEECRKEIAFYAEMKDESADDLSFYNKAKRRYLEVCDAIDELDC